MRLRIWAILAAVLLALVVAGGVAFYVSFLTDLPALATVDDYKPPRLSRVLDREGRLIGEFFNERRQLVGIERIPRHTQLAFVAAEDSAFFEHAGIDYVSILRAAWVDLTAGEIRQGASTITMQLVKQLLLTPERRFRRKIREMILARRLEQNLTKEEILYLYLNHIYFGNGAHGIQEAAFAYFDKDVSELTVGESAMLAGLPQRPSAYSPLRNPDLAERRRQYVLRRMKVDGVITEEQYEEARLQPPEISPPESREKALVASYFTEEVRRYLFDRLGGEVVLDGGLTIETTLDLDLQASAVESLTRGLMDHDKRQGYRGPLRHVGKDEIESEIEKLGELNGLPQPIPEEDPVDELAEAIEEVDEDPVAELSPELEGLEDTEDTVVSEEITEAELEAPAALPLDTVLVGVVLEVDTKAKTAKIGLGPGVEGRVELASVEWAREPDPKRRPRPVTKIASVFKVGDVAHFEAIDPATLEEPEEGEEPDPATLPLVSLTQTPIVQGALFSIDVPTGDVLALVGGYDFEQSQFNRATQAVRQPGSSFKPFIYGAALSKGMTPVETLYDRPIVYKDPVSGFVWRPQNYSRHFYGPMPMRTALVRSVNNATVHLFRDVGVDYVIDFARRMGIQAPLQRDLSLALGSSSVTLLELTSAYAVFPNKGRRVTPRFITRVTDGEGNVLLEDVPLGDPAPPVLKPLTSVEEAADDSAIYPDGEILPTEQIISEAAAYLMCDLLMAVVKDPRGTGWRLKKLGRPLGGKTGTTNDQADAWFMGFSPTIATGVWVGHDESRLLGWGETGSRAAAPIWVDYMKVALSERPIRDFEAPANIVFERIDRATGLLADATSAEPYFQPFLEGTEPTESTTADNARQSARRALRADSF